MNQRTRSGGPAVAERVGGADSMPILTTKRYWPPVIPGLEERIRLMGRLDRVPQCPLALISTLEM